MSRNVFLSFIAMLMMGMALFGCNGGGGSGGGSSDGSGSGEGEDSFSISGTISVIGGGPLAGVTLTLSGTDSNQATTDANGNYTFTSLANGSYTITPTLVGYSFNPVSQAVTVSGADVFMGSFTANATYTPPQVTITSPNGNIEIIVGTTIKFVGTKTTGSVSILQHNWTISGTSFSETMSLNPTYQFTTPGIYTVTLTVSDGLSSPYASVIVTVKDWGTAQLIETDNDVSASSPEIAFDGSGNAIALWCNNGTLWYPLACRYTPSGGWDALLTINENWYLSFGTSSSHIAINDSGEAIAVWQENDGTRWNIWANRTGSTTGGFDFFAAQLIETNNSGDAEDPQVAMDDSGNAIVVWHQNDGTRWNIWANLYTPSFVWGTWGTPQIIQADSSWGARNQQIAMDGSGNAIAVWEQDDGTRWNIWANLYTPSSGWGTAQLIETNNAGNAEDPQVAMDDSGNAIVVWHQNDGTRWNIWANLYTPSSGWGTAQRIETDNTVYEGIPEPQVAMDSSGNAIAVWNQFDGARFNIWANLYTPSSGWGTAQLIETNNAGSASSQQIAFDSSGNAIAVWKQTEGLNSSVRNNIWANLYTPSRGWGTAQLIETNNAGDANNPQIAIDGSGNAIAVWEQYDGHRTDIWANVFK